MAANATSESDTHQFLSIIGRFRQLPAGGVYQTPAGTELVWGNIGYLVEGLGLIADAEMTALAPRLRLPRSFPARLIAHARGLDFATLRSFGAMILVKGSAELFMLDDEAVRGVFVVDADGPVKLGQLSGPREFGLAQGTATLMGGFHLPRLAAGIGMLHSGSDRGDRHAFLDAGRIAKLSKRDRDLAVAKQQQPRAWGQIVREGEQEADLALGTFLTACFDVDRRFHGTNLASLLSGVLLNDVPRDREYWITLRSGPIQLDRALDRLDVDNDVDVSVSPCACALSQRELRKPAWEIRAQVGGRRYLVARIQPSFEGGSIGAEQTKGIVYHFQEAPSHRSDGEGSVWDLLDAISADRRASQ